VRISVLGLGYVGLVTAACTAKWGNHVVGVDSDAERVRALEAGEVPIFEPNLSELVAEGLAAGRLRVGSDAVAAVVDADLVMVAVGTHDGNGGWQSKTLRGCLTTVVPHLGDDAVLVIRSTIPPGSLAQLHDDVRRLRLAAGRPPVALLCNPEFTREGSAVHDFLCPDRVVIGVLDDPDARGRERMAELYAPVDAPKLVLDGVDALLSKLGANLFLATKISFANELARLCDAFGARVEEVTRAMSYDTRIGGGFLRAGVGYGGSCLPNQVSMMAKDAAALGVPTPLLSAVKTVNERQRDALIDHLDRLLAGVDAKRIALLGLSFKPDTDDLRDAPSLDIAARLIRAGATVVAYDPMESARTKAARIVEGLEISASAAEACDGADAIALVTEWPEFSRLDWAATGARMRRRVVVDGRNALPEDAIRAAGFRYAAFGRPRRAMLPAVGGDARRVARARRAAIANDLPAKRALPAAS
jgi:UDPglucose 6-dehydrogenase